MSEPSYVCFVHPRAAHWLRWGDAKARWKHKYRLERIRRRRPDYCYPEPEIGYWQGIRFYQ